MAKHKIWLNKEQGESIEWQIADEMTVAEWYDQVERFKEFQKTIDKSYSKGFFKIKKEDEIQTGSNTLTDELFPREIMVELLKAYYTFPIEASERRIQEIISIYGLPINSKDDIKRMVFKAISRYRISPEEVGLKRFPAPGDNNLKDLIK